MSGFKAALGSLNNRMVTDHHLPLQVALPYIKVQNRNIIKAHMLTCKPSVYKLKLKPHINVLLTYVKACLSDEV